MDSLDKAAAFADADIASSVNKENLLASGRSSRLSLSIKSGRFECSSNSFSINYSPNRYGSIPATASAIPRANQIYYAAATRQQTADSRIEATNLSSTTTSSKRTKSESSWLLKHYMPKVIKNSENLIAHNNSYSLNNHLYDNISFAADSTPLTRSLSRKLTVAQAGVGSNSINDDIEEDDDGYRRQFGCCFGKFRIFLSCYLLLGITLAIYSRNALSLAVVGMVANNEVNNEMVNILAAVANSKHDFNLNQNTSANSGSEKIVLDGSCPLVHHRESSRELYAKIASTSPLVAPDLYQNGLPLSDSMSSYRASIKERVERGELVDWSPSEQGLIFAAGSVGNLLISIPLTRLGEIYGPKWVIFAALFGATLQAALMPLISPCNIILVIIFQVIFCGLTFGADCVAYTFFAHWLTPVEMAFFVSCLLICYQLGNIISSFVTASILTRGIAWSWCFYAPAILCGAWTIVWGIIGASEPATSYFVSRSELNYLFRKSKLSEVIEEDTEQQEDFRTSSTTSRQTKSREFSNNNLINNERLAREDGCQNEPSSSVSWLKLAKDPNIWAIIAVKFTLRWYFTVYASLMPTYLSSVTHMSVDTIGNMSVFQSFVGLFSGILMGYLTRSVILSRPFNLSLAAFRKIFQSIVNFGLASSLLIFLIFDCNQWVTIVMLTISGICINFYVAAALQLPLDLSPNYCGLITSISNTLALGQALGSPISGLILNDGPKDRSLWRIVWGVVILLNTFSGLLFIFLVDSKPRDYRKNNPEEQSFEEEPSMRNNNRLSSQRDS